MSGSILDQIPQSAIPVRLFWGFRRREVSQEKFFQALGSVFIPSTVSVMNDASALEAYLPAVIDTQMSPWVPDEIAVVVYRSLSDYHRAHNQLLGGRAYQLLHDSVFEPLASNSRNFPQALPEDGLLTPDTPYYLVHQQPQWQLGTTRLHIFIRRPDEAAPSFVNHVATCVKHIANLLAHTANVDAGPDCVLVRYNSACITYLEHWPLGNVSDTFALQFHDFTTPMGVYTAKPQRVPAYLNSADPNWLTVKPGDFLNMQFLLGQGSLLA